MGGVKAGKSGSSGSSGETGDAGETGETGDWKLESGTALDWAASVSVEVSVVVVSSAV